MVKQFKPKSICAWFLAVVILSVISACTPPASDTDVDNMAEGIMLAFQEGNVDTITRFYDERFYKIRNPEQWHKELSDLFKEHGKAKSISIRNKTADTRFSGKFYIYLFDSVHEDNKRLKHTLTLIRPVDQPDQIAVIGHLIKTK